MDIYLPLYHNAHSLWETAYPCEPIKQELGEGQGSSCDLRGLVVHHVVVKEGQLHEVLGQSVLLCISLKKKKNH